MNLVGGEGDDHAWGGELVPDHTPYVVRGFLLGCLHGNIPRLLPINGAGKLDWRSVNIVVLALWDVQINTVCLPNKNIIETIASHCPGWMETRPLGGVSTWAASDLDTVCFEAGEAFVGEAHVWRVVSEDPLMRAGREISGKGLRGGLEEEVLLP